MADTTAQTGWRGIAALRIGPLPIGIYLAAAFVCGVAVYSGKLPNDVIGGLSVNNTLTAVLLGYAALVLKMHALALWPAIFLHAVLLGWCVACLRADDVAAPDPREAPVAAKRAVQ